MKVPRVVFLALVTVLLLEDHGAVVYAQSGPTAHHADGRGVSLNGYDPVSYFPVGGLEPIQGSPDHSVTHEGVTYWFATPENAQRFEAEPDRFRPLYGGWCAWAMARDQRVVPDPEAYSINGNRLFVFYDKTKRDDWLAHVDRDAAKANGHWASFSGGEDESLRLVALARTVDKYDLDRKTLGAAGYDPVAYFPEGGGKTIKGDKNRKLSYRGVEYRFSSALNLARFKQNPSRYEPAFGGWCAYAMAKEDYTEPDPKTFIIQDGRLLLFYRGLLGNTLKSWNKEGPAELEPLADEYWSSETGEAVRR